MKTFGPRFERIPRIELIAGPTPIERLYRIEKTLGDALCGTRLYVKRDDLMGIGGGGNKLRKLEFLMGEALSSGADTIITVGGRQSNHARLTAAVAARLGLRCELMLKQVASRHDREYQHGGNILLNSLFGATVHDVPSSVHVMDYANIRAAKLRAEGRSVYVAPAGGSSPVGCLGYAVCAREILDQSNAMGIRFDRIIVANGSSGTHAGLAAGFAALGLRPSIVRSFSVLDDEENSHRTTIAAARATLDLLDERIALDETEIDVRGTERGAAYGASTKSMIDAVRFVAACEGLLLDPVYSGKAFAGLLAGIHCGDYAPGQNVLFIMTGGTHGLFAYRSEFARSSNAA